jgi:hypothetical protein
MLLAIYACDSHFQVDGFSVRYHDQFTGGMASGDGGADLGGDARRPYDVCADWREASFAVVETSSPLVRIFFL